MGGSGKFRRGGGGGVLKVFCHFNISVRTRGSFFSHRGPCEPPLRVVSREEFVPVLLMEHIATWDFPSGGVRTPCLLLWLHLLMVLLWIHPLMETNLIAAVHNTVKVVKINTIREV